MYPSYSPLGLFKTHSEKRLQKNHLTEAEKGPRKSQSSTMQGISPLLEAIVTLLLSTNYHYVTQRTVSCSTSSRPTVILSYHLHPSLPSDPLCITTCPAYLYSKCFKTKKCCSLETTCQTPLNCFCLTSILCIKNFSLLSYSPLLVSVCVCLK